MRFLLFALSLAASATLFAEISPGERRSGYEFMSPATRAMQDDDATNPALFWLLDGEALWSRKAGRAGKSCADCHGDAAQSMRGVAARYPAYDGAAGGLLNLEQRINACRSTKQQASVLAQESRELLSIVAYVGRQSRGMPIAVEISDATKPHLDAGRRIFHLRMGQLNLSCAQCHDERWGKSLAGNPIPQAHPTGYPLYRLEWQGLGSLARRIRGCMTSIRAEPWAQGALEMVELELYLVWRARGMKLETPAVRP